MAIVSTWCPVLGSHVTRVTDFENHITRIICGEYEEAGGACRAKQRVLEGGPLGQLLERVSEDALGSRSTQCILRAA